MPRWSRPGDTRSASVPLLRVLRTQEGPNGEYVRGMHCAGCRSLASAGAAASAKSSARQETLIPLAAQAWSLWDTVPGEQRAGKSKNQWVAEWVGSRLPSENFARSGTG